VKGIVFTSQNKNFSGYCHHEGKVFSNKTAVIPPSDDQPPHFVQPLPR
jgi:hypothetical protein